MTVCDRANFLAETLTQVHRSGQDNVFCAESCQLKHILRNSDLYHNRMTTIFLAKLFPLYWFYLMHSTHVITRVLVKEASSKLPPTLNPSYTRRTWWKFLKVVFTIRNTNLSNTNSLFHVLQHNQNCLKVKNRMKIHLFRSTLPSFLPASTVSSVMLTKHFPSDRCSFFIIRRRTLLQGRWAIFVSHTVRISRLYEQHLPLSVRYFLITKRAPI